MDFEARIRAFAPLQRMPSALQDKAVQLAEVRRHARGHMVYSEGDGDEHIHFLIAGSIELLWHGKVTRTLSANHKAALRALDQPGRKRYGARALEGVTVARFLRAELNRLIGQSETVAIHDNELEVSEIESTRSSDWMIRMLQSGLFSVLPATNIQHVFARMAQIELKAGETVVQQGSDGDCYYVIERGYCEVSRSINAGRGHIHLADLGPGTAFGEEALISNKPRNATVTMVTDGRLMRLAKDDFVELILNQVLHPVSLELAQRQISEGAVWLDIRYPEEHASAAFPASENIPVNMLRLQSNRLRKDFRYLICGEDVEQCAIGAFLLAERGFDVAYLDEPMSAVAARAPEQIRQAPAEDPATPVQVINFPGAEMVLELVGSKPSGGGAPSDPFDNTITRIAALSTQAEAERDMHDTTPVEQYANTATGRALADIIGELAEQHDQLARPEPVVAPRLDLDRDQPPVAAAGGAGDGISALMQEMEVRMRREVAHAVTTQSALIAADYRLKIARMRELTNEELRHKERSLRAALADEFREREQLLRGYYKKLIALANKISRQKAQLQQARQQFEGKLAAANLLYREIEEMRQLLAGHIAFMDGEPLEELPPLTA